VGSYVRTTQGGVVLETGDDAAYGLYVKVMHDAGISSLYAHNSWLFVSAGDSVEIGEVIALSGNSGRSTAPHLHVEIEREGLAVDPLAYLAEGT
jgi:murein DD-endopeptidase MepM/ murein hydrolase activator NlpD